VIVGGGYQKMVFSSKRETVGGNEIGNEGFVGIHIPKSQVYFYDAISGQSGFSAYVKGIIRCEIPIIGGSLFQ